MELENDPRSCAIASHAHRSVTHLAQEVRAGVAAMRDHARLLLESQHDRSDGERGTIKAILREASGLDRLIDELDSRWSQEVAVLRAPGAMAIDALQARPRVLVADDDGDCLENLVALLGERYEVATARNGSEALDRLRAGAFDLAILDQQMPGLSGLEVAEQFAVDASAPPSFMFLSGESSAKVRVRGLSLGAADFVMKPVDPDELIARVARVLATVRREQSLVADALNDEMTGLPNYRSLTRTIELELDRAERYDLPLSLLTIDLDDLKAINDDFGHDAGSDAICLVGSVLKGAVRKFDTVARQGGDEFSILLPNATQHEALQFGERVRCEVAQRRIRGRRLSISVGVASRERGGKRTSVRSLVNDSDSALYLSKRAGRNRVSGFPAPDAP